MFHKDLPERVVISDMRFINEMEAVLSNDGFCARVLRDTGVGEDLHASENELGGTPYAWDYTITNNGSLADLSYQVEELVTHIGVNSGTS